MHPPRAVLALTALVALAGAPAAAKRLNVPLVDTPLEACPGDAIEPDEIVEGQLPGELMGATVMFPFEVPAGTTSVRVKYCWESGHTVDLGIWDARPGRKAWAEEQFRGWGGSSHPDVTITPQGFSTEAEYEAEPRGHVPGRTTRGYRPGPLPPGSWAAELGVASVAPNETDGVDFRLEIELSSDPAFAAEPYVPAPYDATPANSAPGWYAGDMHVHAEHSALGDATMTETFDFAFRSLEDGGAGLDFITLSDYVVPSGWDEIGRYQALHPGKLVIRSSEVITYHGHSQNHASARYVDHRAGPLYELLRPSGDLKRLRKKRDPRAWFKEIRKAGGWTQLNHPTTCPTSIPICSQICRGCAWDYTEKQTKLSFVDAIEVHNGPPDFQEPTSIWTTLALALWEDALAKGFRITAVGSSDSHHDREPGAARHRPHGRLRAGAVGAGHSRRGPRRPRLREGLRARGARAAARRQRSRQRGPAGDHGRRAEGRVRGVHRPGAGHRP